ncbi:MAG TPA: chromate transporter, partial [Candidatus Binataceae bacterium]|nr:chromate transporter [Candidatus Binataceae bacterium]
MKRLTSLSVVFAGLGLMAVGGGTAVLPEMQHVMRELGWLSDKQFIDIYSLGQVAPGPNMLMVMVIGYRLSGWAGAVAVGASFFLPDCVLTLAVNRVWHRFRQSPWRLAI